MFLVHGEFSRFCNWSLPLFLLSNSSPLCWSLALRLFCVIDFMPARRLSYCRQHPLASWASGGAESG